MDREIHVFCFSVHSVSINPKIIGTKEMNKEMQLVSDYTTIIFIEVCLCLAAASPLQHGHKQKLLTTKW